jgi:hypothetical protein
MATFYETGDSRNIAQFQNLLLSCRGFGTGYRPAKTALQLESLETLLARARQTFDELTAKRAVYNSAVGIRQTAFAKLRPFCTRLVSAYASSDLPEKAVGDARAIQRKLQGYKLRKPAAPTDPNAPEPTEKAVSTSRQSFDLLCEHFDRMVAIARNDAGFRPNEPELQLAGLEQFLTDLKSACGGVAQAWIDLQNARMARNAAFYGPNGSLCNTALEVKKYVKSVYGANAPQYEQISGMAFTKK